MRHMRKTSLLAALLTGAWLGTTITCDPGSFDAVIHVVDDGPYIVEDHHCDWCWWDEGGGFFFDYYED